jgi:hypothetical protein
MQLVILCRTQGVDIADFIFREGSNVAVHILDSIAIDAAGLALRELHYVAECLLKDALWKTLASAASPSKKALTLQSSLPAHHNTSSTREKLYELLRVTRVQPVLHLPKPHGSIQSANSIPGEVLFLFSSESGINWKSCCSSMKRIPSFSPNWSFVDDTIVTNLFYLKRYDVFLKLTTSQDTSALLSADVIEKEQNPNNYQSIFETMVGFLLEYVWHNL